MIFPVISWLAIYFVVWWISLFVVLPFAGRSQAEAGVVVPGSEPGAPARFPWTKMFGLTTVVATVVFAGLMWTLTQTHFTLDDVPFLPRYPDV